MNSNQETIWDFKNSLFEELQKMHLFNVLAEQEKKSMAPNPLALIKSGFKNETEK